MLLGIWATQKYLITPLIVIKPSTKEVGENPISGNLRLTKMEDTTLGVRGGLFESLVSEMICGGRVKRWKRRV